MTENKKARIAYIDFLKSLGLICIMIAHADPPRWVQQIRNFDVPLMVILSSMLISSSYKKKYLGKKKEITFIWERAKRLVILICTPNTGQRNQYWGYCYEIQ